MKCERSMNVMYSSFGLREADINDVKRINARKAHFSNYSKCLSDDISALARGACFPAQVRDNRENDLNILPEGGEPSLTH